MDNRIVIALAITALLAGISLWRRPQHWYLSLGVILTAGAVIILPQLASGSADDLFAELGWLLVLGTIHLTLCFALLIAHGSERERQESDRVHAAWLAERQRSEHRQ